jgi:hypothetical protein
MDSIGLAGHTMTQISIRMRQARWNERCRCLATTMEFVTIWVLFWSI